MILVPAADLGVVVRIAVVVMAATVPVSRAPVIVVFTILLVV
ncbi:MAG TPA: hypothetical protein VGS27_31225 [Candidatus Sulfotelmatobacter sp.]|nr:hypothetical protein [Candidatus Sulfotelmatobacter sp.]